MAADDDDDEDDEDDDDETPVPAAPLKSALKQAASAPAAGKQKAAPAKAETKPAANNKPATPAADKPLNKTQLFINSIKESVSVSDVKTLYPKATTVKLQKRKVGPNKFIQFAFVNFENESECADAFKAHTQIGGEKVNISYAFAQGKKQEVKPSDSTKKPEQKPANESNKNKPAKEAPKKKEKVQAGESNDVSSSLSLSTSFVPSRKRVVHQFDLRRSIARARCRR